MHPETSPNFWREKADELRAQLRAAYGDDYDGQFFDIAVDTETDFDKVAGRIVRRIREDEAFAKALGEIAKENAARKKAFDERASKNRDTLCRMMVAIDKSTIKVAEATITARMLPPKIEVDWSQDKMRGYAQNTSFVDCEVKYYPNEEVIWAAITAGTTFDGVTLTDPEPSLTIRK